MIAGYKLLRKIGSGGFGQIYLGEEEISGRKVAIKTLKESADIFENTKHEIHIISQFYHPNIVTYHTTLLDGETVYIVMEYCKKGSLSEKIVQKPIQLDEALYIVQTIAKTLKFVHDKGIVHHDVKPANILLAEDNQIKLADFGIANSNGFTKIYIPPNIDITKDHKFDKTLDIYALGITLVELIKGQHPLIALSREEAVKKIRKGNLGISHFPEWLQEVILKAINLNESARFQVMDEFIEAIEHKEIALNIDYDLIRASQKARSIKNKLYRKKYNSIRKDIEQLKQTSLLKYPILLEQVGAYYLAINDITNARYIYELLREKVPSLDINKQLGFIYIQEGAYAKAINLFKEYVAVNPADIETYNLLLNAYFKNKRFWAGYELCIQLRKAFPNELCFKANLFLFREMLRVYNGIVKETKIPTNYFTQYNEDILNRKEEIVNPKHDDGLLNKLLFCDYNITKAKSYNNEIEIYLDNRKLDLPVYGFITIGRTGYDNTIEIQDVNVSRKHCILLPYKNENWLYDLQSTGTFVDGIAVNNKIRLTHKHHVKIGSHILTLNVDRNKLF